MFYYSKVGSRALPQIAAVYCIEDYLTGERYIGSCANLRDRLGQHRRRETGAHEMVSRGTYEVTWIPCGDKLERRKLEQLAMNTIDCVNEVAAYQTREERKEYRRLYMQRYSQGPKHKEYCRQYRAAKKLKQLDIA